MQATNKGVWTLVRVTVEVSTDHKRRSRYKRGGTGTGKRIVEKGRYMRGLNTFRRTRFSQTK